MIYENIFRAVKTAYNNADKSVLDEDFAIQFNITGESAGAFYTAFRGGFLEVAPYDYGGCCAMLYASGEDFIKLTTAKISLEEGIAKGLITIEGKYKTALVLNKIAYAEPEQIIKRKNNKCTYMNPAKKAGFISVIYIHL